MALGLFKKQVPQTIAPATEVMALNDPATTESAEGDSAREILELLSSTYRWKIT